MRKALELLIGSCVVYAVVVACGQASPHAPEKVAAHAGEPGGGGEASSRGGRDSVGGQPSEGGLGGLLDPVPDAGAAETGGDGPTMCDCPEPEPYAPPEPIVLEAPCDIRLPATGLTVVYAEVARPNVSDARLMGARAWLIFDEQRGPLPIPRDYRQENGGGLFVSETHIAVFCGGEGPQAGTLPARAVFFIP